MKYLKNIKSFIYVMAAFIISVFCFDNISFTSHASAYTNDYSFKAYNYSSAYDDWTEYTYHFSSDDRVAVLKYMYGTIPTYTVFYNDTSNYSFTYDMYVPHNGNSLTDKEFHGSYYLYTDDNIAWVTGDTSDHAAHTFQVVSSDIQSFDDWEKVAYFDWGNVPVFEDVTALSNYFFTGSLTGSQLAPKNVELDSFSLIGFDCDNSIHASWNGYTFDESLGVTVKTSDIKVNVVPLYFLTLEKGEEEQDFETEGLISVNYTDFLFDKSYSDYFIDNPYIGRIKLRLSFYPSYYDQYNNILYRGKSISVQFDENGEIVSIDFPEASLTSEYNDFYLKNFTATSEFHNFSDSYIHCYWNGSSVDGVVDYVYSGIKVQLYCHTGEDKFTYKWIDYNLDDIVSIRSNRLDFNLTDIDTYCRDNDCWFYDSSICWSNEIIRITPYYKTTSQYIYGRSVEISLTKLGGIGSILQSTGDAINGNPTYDDLQSGYLPDFNDVIDSVDDSITDPETSKIDIELVASNFFTLIWDLFRACGQFPSLVASVFSFLPNYYNTMIVISLSVILILRILGR